MNIEITGSPIFTTLPILGGIPITATLVVTWGIMLLLTVFCIWLTHDLRVDNVTTRQTIAEFLVNTAQGFVDNNMGVRFSHYAPFIAAIFSLSLLSSLSGLLGLFSPTADLSTELGWAVLVFVLITATKIKTNGVGPKLALAILSGMSAQQFVNADFAASFRVNFLNDNRTVEAVFAIFRRQIT